jgi:hypothetical protein
MTSIFIRKKGTFEAFRVHPNAPILERVGKNEDDIEIISEDDFKRYQGLQRAEMERLHGQRVGPVPAPNMVAAVGKLEDMTKKQLLGLVELEQLVVVKTPNITKGELIAAIERARQGKAPEGEVSGAAAAGDESSDQEQQPKEE